ncbi:hypothetical protein KRM28CT15_41380 [Krasilnikovia sp. M28-CT-15]
MWKTVAVRPVLASHAFSARSRGTALNPPAEAPHNTPHAGTSSASVRQARAVGGGAAGVLVAVVALGGGGTGDGSGPPHAPSAVAVRAAIAHATHLRKTRPSTPRAAR